jgi:hypothetical protein
MPISHAQTVATKGLISGNALTLASKGYIHILIEEIPIPTPKKRGGSSGEMTKKFGKKKERKKIVKVTIIYNKIKYVEAKIVDMNVKVTSRDVDVKIGEQVKIDIKVDGVKVDKEDIDKL